MLVYSEKDAWRRGSYKASPNVDRDVALVQLADVRSLAGSSSAATMMIWWVGLTGAIASEKTSALLSC